MVKAPTFIDIMIDNRIVGFAESVLAPVAPSIILNNGEVIDIGPGESAQPMHRDDDAWNFANVKNPMMINTICRAGRHYARNGSNACRTGKPSAGT
jgi:hypothetical protein